MPQLPSGGLSSIGRECLRNKEHTESANDSRSSQVSPSFDRSFPLYPTNAATLPSSKRNDRKMSNRNMPNAAIPACALSGVGHTPLGVFNAI